ncbi:MAG: YggS family pyridoxal phosphate-dependent enzyme [Bacteroidota bacterium]
MIDSKSIEKQLELVKNQLDESVTLVAVSKTKPQSDILEAYECGQVDFGENKAQEMAEKYEALPKDIQWHMIGHLQRNKVKYIAPFVHLVHSVDSFRLLKEINKQAEKVDRKINCLLQMHIAMEDTKYGLDEAELIGIMEGDDFKELNHIKITGLMGMATNTENQETVKQEFEILKALFEKVKVKYKSEKVAFNTLSMGMSGDYKLAIECGSNMVRIGSTIFGERNYNN